MNERTTLTKTELSEEHQCAIVEALTAHYQGLSIEDAFAKVDCGKVTYYKYKKQNPGLIAKLDAEARALVLQTRAGFDLAFESQQLETSYRTQRAAAEALEQAVPMLLETVKGAVRIYIDPTREKGKQQRVVLCYPRDQLKAAELLQSIARGGSVPEQLIAKLDMRGIPIVIEKEPEMIPLLGISTHFSKVSAVTPDGRVITAEVHREAEVIEGVVDEVG